MEASYALGVANVNVCEICGIAHRSLELVLDGNAKPLGGASRQDTADAIQAIDNLLNFVENHYCQTGPTYYEAMSAFSGADSLLYICENGLKAQNAKSGC